MSRVCIKCGLSKPDTEFHKSSHDPNEFRGACKLCYKDQCRRYAKTAAGKLSKGKTNTKQRVDKPVKYKARYTLTNAVRDGKIMKPKDCERCGKGGQIDGHHHDYSKPLDVNWLCVPCHNQEHVS